MKQLPIFPTLLVAAAVLTMIALGFWQLRRGEEKAQLLQAVLAEGRMPPTIVDCRIDAAPEVRAGRNVNGEVGYRYLVPCGASLPGLKIVVGWSRSPTALARVRTEGRLEATSNAVNRQLLTLRTPLPPLEAAAPPDITEIPDNHLMYAIQWFFFALAAAVIYVIALRRRSTPPRPE
jgi:hypothetical protein